MANKGDKDFLVVAPTAAIQTQQTSPIIKESEGQLNDRFCVAYTQYLNRKTEQEGKQLLKDLNLMGTDLIRMLERLGDTLCHKYPFATPPINYDLRSKVDMSVEMANSELAIRYLNYTQLIVQPWYKTFTAEKLTPELVSGAIQALYEMIRLLKDIVELTEIIDPGFKNTALVQ